MLAEIRRVRWIGRGGDGTEEIPRPPPPPTAEQLKTVADRPFSAGGPKREPKRKPAATKRPREAEAATAAPAPKKLKKLNAPGTATPVALVGTATPTAAAAAATAAAAPPPLKTNPVPAADLKRPPVPDLDVQEARILFRNASLVKHLRAHPLGDWVKNPHRKVAGKETATKTKDRAADAIKGVIREWLLTTPAGRRALAAADVGEGELSIDRLIARRERGSMSGLNCIYNLYLMPVRHNSHFGSELTAEKRAYVGKRALQLASAAHETFVRDTEGEYDWDRFYKKADNIVNQG